MRHTHRLDFPKGEGNSIHVVIYVPSTKNVVQKISPIEFKSRILETVRLLRKLFGGSTTVNGIGNYKADDFGNVTEDVAKVECFTNRLKYYKLDLKLQKWLKNKKKKWGQESLSYEYEEQLFFV